MTDKPISSQNNSQPVPDPNLSTTKALNNQVDTLRSLVSNGINGHSELKTNGDVNLRRSHPNLYRSMMIFAFIDLAMACNFFFTNPTFVVYGTSKRIWGVVFLVLGLGYLITLNFYRSLTLLRVVAASAVSFFLFFGAGTAVTFFTGDTSLQLFVLYIGLCLLHLPLLCEPPVQPLTERGLK